MGSSEEEINLKTDENLEDILSAQNKANKNGDGSP